MVSGCMFGWFKKRSEIVATQSDRYFLLYRDGREVRATDASKIMRSGNFPRALKVGNYEYRVVEDEDTFIFWDELRDPSNRTVGFTFLLPDSATLARSYLLTD